MAKIQNEIDVDSIYESLSTYEKKEMWDLMIENKNYDLDDFYDSLSHREKSDLVDKLDDDDYIDNGESEPEIECDKLNNLNIALLSLLDKSYMLNKCEIESIKNIADKYKYFG